MAQSGQAAKIAVIGAGLVGRRHVEHIVAEPRAALHCIVDPTEAARAFAAERGLAWRPSVAAMLEDGRPDGVIVATPNQLHVRNALEAIEAGVPALVEKPLADDLEGAARIVAAAEAAKVPLLTGHHRRHNPMIARAKALIDEGRLGRLVAAHSFFWLMKPDDYFDVAWRRESGAGPVLINLIHDIDLMRHLCGEVAEVKAFQSNAVRGFPVEETTAAILRFENGALGTVNVSDTVVAPWSWEQTTGENPAYPHTDQICYHLAGTHGALSIPRLEVWSNPDKRSWWEPLRMERIVAPDEDPLRRQIRQFCAVIRGEERPLVSGREGLRTLAVVEAVRRAAETGDSVKVKL